MTLDEYRSRCQSGDYFLKKVLAGDLITLWGTLE